MNKVLILSSLVVSLFLSGCAYKVELISQKDNSVYYGTMEDFTETFDFNIRGERFSGDWIVTGATTYGTGLVNNQTMLISGKSRDGGMLKQRGDKGGYLSCSFTVDHSTDMGTCNERVSGEAFDITIK
ncbi:MAG: hypothetical protein WBK67_02470 [Minisyncoccales bacterium]